ncbi:hypothetical protein C8R47DRAFT_1206880 [Mycena vitilis]|nr:hypothetical protein C8R47DRAFT_1206880 [Mycena vitilis]
MSRVPLYVCSCELEPFRHRIPINDRMQHEEELAQWKLQGGISENGASESEPACNSSETRSEPDSLDDINTFIAALTLTDDGPTPASQPSKLFTSRAEFQDDRSAQNPTGFNPGSITVADAASCVPALFIIPPLLSSTPEGDGMSANSGVRWSELGRLPYWDPSSMLVTDPMHCFVDVKVARRQKIAAKPPHIYLPARPRPFSLKF